MARKIFTPDFPALPMNYPGFVFRTLREEGYAVDSLLAGTGLAEAQLSDPNFRCGFQPLRRLFLNAMALTGDLHLGAKLALKFQPTYVGLPSYTAMNAECFDDGLNVLVKYFSINFPAFDFYRVGAQSGLQAGETAIRLRSKFAFGDIEYFGFISAIVAIDGLLKAMLRIDQVSTRAEMTTCEPEKWPAVEAEIGFPVRFEAAENRIFFPETLLERPLPGSDPINHQRLLGLCGQFAEELGFETTPVTQVRAILDKEQNPAVSLSDIAARLGYSERGLRRQLDRSGTSYRKLVDETREGRARDLLSDGALPIKAIAGALGFDSSSNFARSFRRWTGLSPKEFRRRTFSIVRHDAGRK